MRTPTSDSRGGLLAATFLRARLQGSLTKCLGFSEVCVRHAVLCFTYFLVTALVVMLVVGFYEGERTGGMVLGVTVAAAIRVGAFLDPFPFKERIARRTMSNGRSVIVGVIAALIDLVFIAVVLLLASWSDNLEGRVGTGLFVVCVCVCIFISIAPIVLSQFGVMTLEGDAEDSGEGID